jgi:hypothetical protein
MSHETLRSPTPTSTDTPRWHLRALLASYPLPWRTRYTDEMEDTVLAMQHDGSWTGRHTADLLRGLGSAWLNPTHVGSEHPTPGDTRRLVPASAWGLLLFLLAGGAFAKLIEDPPFLEARQHHVAQAACIDVLTGCAVATAIVMAICTLPSLVTLARREPRHLRPLLVVPASAAVVAAAVAIAKYVAEGAATQSTRQVVAACVLGGVTLAAAVCSTVAIMHVAVRAPAGGIVELTRRAAMVVVAVLTAIGVLAVVTWVAVAEVQAPHLMHSNGGFLGTPTLPSLVAALAGLLAAATLCGVSGVRAVSSRAGVRRSTR